jgi:hypothetical protein
VPCILYRASSVLSKSTVEPLGSPANPVETLECPAS